MNTVSFQRDSPMRGAIALCKYGRMGLITKDEPTKDGYWKGILISRRYFSATGNWQSKQPIIVGNIDRDKIEDFIAALEWMPW